MARKTLRTKLCDLLDIEYPIILAGMGPYSGPTLAAAVSNAGGLGVMGGTGLSAETLAKWIKKAKNLTRKPFGVDLAIPALPPGLDVDSVADLKIPEVHLQFVNKLMHEFGIPRPKNPPQVELSTKLFRKQVEVIIDERVPVFVSGLGSPDWVIPNAHAHGIKVIGLVGNVRNARRIAEAGADVIVACGQEGGGHVGKIGTLPLVPQVVDAVYPTPVVAAGGIADGRGLVAALALGACGVLLGTAFLVAHECYVDTIEAGVVSQWHVDYWKQKIIEASEEDTVVTKSYTGKPMRNLKNKWIAAWERADAPPTLPIPLQLLLSMEAMKGAEEAGIKDIIVWPTGQIAGMIKQLKSAKQIVDGMVDSALRVLGESLPASVITGP